MKEERMKAIKILNEFEEVLMEKEIRIPDKSREGLPGEACIFGETYYRLEDAITRILEE